MSTPVLSSDLTRTQLVAIYQDAADYDLVGSLAQARRFIQAGRMLLALPLRRSASGGRGGEEVELEPRIVQEQIARAEAWYHTRASDNSQLEPRQLVPADDFRC